MNRFGGKKRTDDDRMTQSHLASIDWNVVVVDQIAPTKLLPNSVEK